MTLIQALILGFIQGLTEFLPISSSGHLVVAQKLLGFNEPPVTYDIYLHLATLAAVIYFFRKSLLHLNRRLVLLLVIATIPAVLFGLIFKSMIETMFDSLWLTSLGFFISAGFIFLSDKIKAGSSKIGQLTFKETLMIGVFQAIAILPSISRSGATIYAGLKARLKREEAVTFAFLISIPAVLGAVVYDWLKLDSATPLPLLPTLMGMLAAFTVGFFCLKLLQILVLKARLYYFGWYCVGVGCLTLFWYLGTILK